VPGWHEQLKDHKDVVQLGLIQEQHPDRCKLFMQWKQMDWPIMVDSLNLLGVKVVPITLFIDEHGIIRKVKPKHEDLSAFLATEYKIAEDEVRRLVEKPDMRDLRIRLKDLNKRVPDSITKADYRDMADQMFLWFTPEHTEMVTLWQRLALAKDDDDGDLHFRAGVALRRHFDLSNGKAEDFAKAVKHWERSLEIDPNHYIRRRRIQQYGPRLDKPYSFYDWINEARTDIKARDEVPVELSVEPTGAEFAHPEKDMREAVAAASPDPDGKINRDESGLIKISAVPVPGKLQAGVASRVHVTFEVNADLKAHWNNESGEAQFWIDAPQGWSIEKRLWPLPQGPGATSIEQRKLEFEVRAPKDVKPGKHVLECYALYYVCEGADGTCLYLRQEISITLEVS
jgi:hypothetical protein